MIFDFDFFGEVFVVVLLSSRIPIMEEEQIDRISKLPDEVMTRILSFVPVEDVAARAKLVSKAWKKLCEFSFDPPLGFVYPVSRFFSTPIPIPEDIDHDIGSFINGVDSSLKSHDSRLGRLILCLDLDYNCFCYSRTM